MGGEIRSCWHCAAEKHAGDFYASAPRKCKECIKAAVAKYRIKNIEAVHEYDRARGRTDKRKKAVKSRAHRYKAMSVVSNREYRQRNKDKLSAHNAVARAVKAGRLIPLSVCEDCATSCKTEAHHGVYAAKLSVRWLCTKCHASSHVEARNVKRKAMHLRRSLAFAAAIIMFGNACMEEI